MGAKDELLKKARELKKEPEKPIQVESVPYLLSPQGVDAAGQETTRADKIAPLPTATTKIVHSKAGDLVFAKMRRPMSEPLEPYEPKRQRRNGKWVKGSSGNPNGRPMTLSAYAYELTGGGQEMIDHAVQCLRGSVLIRWENDYGDPCERWAPAQLKDQADARKYLEEAIRPQVQRALQEQGDIDPWNFDALTSDELVTFQALLAKVRARVTGLSGQGSTEGSAGLEPSHCPPIAHSEEGEPAKGGGERDLSTDPAAPGDSVSGQVL